MKNNKAQDAAIADYLNSLAMEFKDVPAVGDRVEFDHRFGDEGPGNWTRIIASVEQKHLDAAATCIIQTLHMGVWIEDGIGDNPPRSLDSCQRDVKAFRAGECGWDMKTLFARKNEGKLWRIKEA